MDADADNISRVNCVGHNLLERFIDKDGITDDRGCGGSKHKEPTGRDDRGAEGIVAGIDEMDAHAANLSPYWCGWLHSNCGDAVTRVDDRKRQPNGKDAALTLRYDEVGPKSTVRVPR